MIPVARRVLALLLLCLLIIPPSAQASAYNGRPKLVIIIVVDQFRADYLERYRDQFVPGGFRLLLDRGAYFTDCYYEYANLHTAPGHATLFTGAYTSGHGIINNDWWDPSPEYKKVVSSVEDKRYRIIGNEKGGTGASPRNLMASTIGDELKLATQGKSRVFALGLKDRSSVLPGGHAADGAYWIDKDSGQWVTSDFYAKELPAWAANFNAQKRNEKYWNLDWKDAKGNVFRTTTPGQKDVDGHRLGFYDIVGSTPYANEYEIEFAKELIAGEKLGSGPATDLLAISFSAYDILGHQVGPDSPQLSAMTLALDKQLAEFFGYLGRQYGLANVWIALSADHGVAPMVEMANRLRIPASRADLSEMRKQVDELLTAKLGSRSGGYLRGLFWPIITLNEEAFPGLRPDEAERLVGEALMQARPGLQGYYTKSQLQAGEVRQDGLTRKYLNSYTPLGGWWVMVQPPPYSIAYSQAKWKGDTSHGLLYSYDAHVPLLFFGLPFAPGTYRTHVEPVDMAVTLSSLLGINKPTHAIGRVLAEALAPEKSRPAAAITEPEKKAERP